MMKKSVVWNVVLFAGIMLIAGVLLYCGKVSAAEAATVAAESSSEGWKYIGAALSVGLACIGAGVAVASAASAALGALSENPGIMGKSMIFVALAESIALYGVLIAFFILTR